MKISLRDKLIYPWNMIISPWDMKIQNFLMWFKNGLGASALSGRMGKTGSAPFPSADGRWFRAYGKTGVFKIWVKRASLNYG